MIDFVIAVRDRSNTRVQRCINSLQSERTGKIIVVDYGSKNPIKVKGAEIIRYTENDTWNKSHALNLGIKRCKSVSICTVDCDMILSKEILFALWRDSSEDTLIINTDVRRLKLKHISSDYDDMISKSKLWFGYNRGKIYSAANGGIQCFPRKWINKVHGYNEHLGIYFGAMDNRVYEQAYMDGLTVVNLNMPMIHQEHLKKKEDNLPKCEREFALDIRKLKAEYLDELIHKGQIINKGFWGREKPNQNYFIKLQIKRQKSGEKVKKILMNLVNKAMEDGKDEVEYNGKIFKIKKD